MLNDLNPRIPNVEAARLELFAVEIENIIPPKLESGEAIEIASPVEIELRQLAASIRSQVKAINEPRLWLAA